MQNRFNAAVVAGAFSFSAGILLWRLKNSIESGGNGFVHADWLISYSDGLIRRGISGEIFLGASEMLEINPLILVGAVQGGLTLVIIASLCVKGLALRMPDQAFLLLLSPALVFFWVNDSIGAFRKEILGLAAFLPLLFPLPPKRQTVAVAVALFLFFCAVFFHEANLLLAPALVAALYLRLGAPRFIVPTAFIAITMVAAAGFAIVFMTVPDTSGMCGRLIEAGLREDRLCQGIFQWLDDGLAGQAAMARAVVADVGTPPVMLLMGAVILLPGVLIARHILDTRHYVIFLASIAVIFLLFPIASDWSRWLSMQVFAMTFLLFIAMERPTIDDMAVPRPFYASVFAFNLGVGIDQIAPVPRNGFLYNILASFESFMI